MTCASSSINSSLLYAKPQQSSAKGSRAHLRQDMFSFTSDRNTMPIYSHISSQPLDGSVTFQDDTAIRIWVANSSNELRLGWREGKGLTNRSGLGP
ncbi:hypothetical protein QQF64_002769 [Cirrhinus molitorella]